MSCVRRHAPPSSVGSRTVVSGTVGRAPGSAPRTARRLAAWGAVVVALAALAPSAAADATVESYPLPSGAPGSGMVAAPGGTVWFTTNDSDLTPRIGRLAPATAQPGTSSGIGFYETPTFLGAPCCATFVRSLAYDGEQQRLWFVRSDGMYGYGRPASMQEGSDDGFSTAVVSHSSGFVGLWGVAYDPVGKGTWLAETTTTNVASSPGYYAGARIAQTDGGLGLAEGPNIALQGGRTTIDSLRYDAKPRGVSIVAGGGNAWFAQSDPGNPGWRIARTNGTGDYTEYLIQPCVGTPCSGSYSGTGPSDTAVAPDGTVWFTNELNRSVGRLDPGGGTFTTYALSSIAPALGAGRPVQIRAAADGTLWVAVYGGPGSPAANAVVRIVPSQPAPTATVYPTGTAGPLSIAPSATGDVWFGLNPASGPGAVGRLAGVTTPPPSGGGGGGAGGGGGGAPAGPGGGGTAPAPTPGGTPLIPSAVGVARAGTVTTKGDTTSVTQICVGPPEDRCSLVYLLQSREYVQGFPGAKSRAVVRAASRKPKARKPPLPILAKVSTTLKGGQRKTTKVRLNAKARKALARKGRIRATLIVQQRDASGKLRTVQRKPVTFRAAKRARS